MPFVQVNWSDHVEAEEDAGDGGWDHHYRNFQIMQDRHAPWLDQALSVLLARPATNAACSDSTLVLAVGEFGRSPKVNDKAGRDHWEHCYAPCWRAAASAAAGVVGSSDARGERAARQPGHARRHRRHASTTPSASPATRRQALGIAVDGKGDRGVVLS